MKTAPDIDIEEVAAVEITGADIHSVGQRAGLLALSNPRQPLVISAGDVRLALQEWISSSTASKHSQ